MPTDRLVAVLRCAAIALCSTTPAFAAVTQWRVEDGGNGHSYDIVVTPLQTWLDARSQAHAMGGYLASITSPQENDWLWTTFNIGGTEAYWAGYYDGPMFGAYRATGSSPWTWLSGEPWGWSNWGWSYNPGEAGAQFIARGSSWDDIDVRGGVAAGGNVAFIVEWDVIPSPGTLGVLGVAGLAACRRRR